MVQKNSPADDVPGFSRAGETLPLHAALNYIRKQQLKNSCHLLLPPTGPCGDLLCMLSPRGATPLHGMLLNPVRPCVGPVTVPLHPRGHSQGRH